MTLSHKSIERYLSEQGHTAQTIKTYMYDINVFTGTHRGAKGYRYRDIIEYIDEKNKEYPGSDTPNRILSSLKKYYDYLVETNQREDHPCRTLYIKSKKVKDVMHQNLFSGEELEKLLNREERYQDLMLKNQAIVSLLIYQGLTTGEITRLKMEHIDFDNGTIFIRGSKNLSQRHLEIYPKQYRILDRYIREGRDKLVRKETDFLMLGKLGNPINQEDISYLVSTSKGLFPERNLNPKTIRQSVIANWLNEKKLPLEQVQLMAGHKWILTTERYKQANLNEQRVLINKWHPLG